MLSFDMLFDDRSFNALYLICNDECLLLLSLPEQVLEMLGDTVRKSVSFLEKICNF
jgi:hypothetical protein